MPRDLFRRLSALNARSKFVFSITTFIFLTFVLLAWNNNVHVTETIQLLPDQAVEDPTGDILPLTGSSGKIDLSTDGILLDHIPELVPQISPQSSSFQPSSPLRQILDIIIIDTAKHGYNPYGTDQDLSDFARQTATFRDLWNIYKSLDATSIDREEFENAIQKVQQVLYPWITASKNGQQGYKSLFDLANSFKEDSGVVISVGTNNFRWAIHQVITLRNVLNSSLPIEIFYAGEDDLPLKFREVFAEIESDNPNAGWIRTVDILQKFPDPDNQLEMPGGWAMRPFAVLASSFKNVILSDADTIFLKDPRALINEPAYKERGALFYHDRLLVPPPDDVARWVDETLENANAKYMDEVRKSGWFKKQTFYEMESGAVVFDKTRVLHAIMMICHMNLKRMRENITYVKFYGDKESYWLSFALVSQPYHFVSGYSGGIGRITKKIKDGKEIKGIENICTLQLLHVLESTGEPLWFNNAITEYKGVSDRSYIVPEGWVPHDGRWSASGTRFPNEFCVEMPEGEHEKLLASQGSKVYRVEGKLKTTIERELEEVEKWDRRLKAMGLIDIKT